jgi:hypothetical protein
VDEARREKEIYNLKAEYYTRDRKAKEYEDKCQSLTVKVDSLVKFLEEERCLRKAAENESQKKDRRIKDYESEISSLKDKLESQS